MKRFSSDVAIVLLNFYPPQILERAVASIRSQTYSGTWTLYLGFHHRDEEHKRTVRALCQGLPVHFVDIPRDLVFDMRARDIILQEALLLGDHRFLFFLDDDDEWYPSYLARMTAPDAPFITCAKDVLNEATGEERTVRGDYDFESMGFHFGLWQDKTLPYFVKQGGDKYLLREFAAAYPQHPDVPDPLYRVHQHPASMTFQKTLGRGNQPDRLLRRRIRVVCSRADQEDELAACARVAGVLQTRCCSPAELIREPVPPELVISSTAALSDCLAYRKDCNVSVPLLQMVSSPPEVNIQHLSLGGKADQADFLLLADPTWVDGYEALGLRCLPAGIPSPETEEAVRDRWQEKASRPLRHVAILERSTVPDAYIANLAACLPPEIRLADSLAEAEAAWYPNLLPNWGAAVLHAFEQGLPCVTSPGTAVARILYGGSPLLTNRLDPAYAARVLAAIAIMDRSTLAEAALPLYRRCFSPFYWLNYFSTYLFAAHVL